MTSLQARFEYELHRIGITHEAFLPCEQESMKEMGKEEAAF